MTREAFIYHHACFGTKQMKTKTDRYDYGECEICDAHIREERINQDFWIRGSLLSYRMYLWGCVHGVARRSLKETWGVR